MAKDTNGDKIVTKDKAAITKGVEIEDSALKKAAKLFFAEDIDHVTDSIVDEFIKPRTKSFGMDLVKKFKEFMFNSLSDLARQLIFGNGPSKRSDSYYSDGYTSYTKYHYGEDYYGNGSSYYYKSNSNVSKPDDRPRDQLKRIGIKTLGKAQEVLDDLRTEIATTEKHQVSIATYYQLVRTSVNKIDFEYGWKRGMLDGNIPIRYVGKDGYLICFPKPVPLDS